MAKGKILIIGPIGDYVDENGETQKGVSLADVVAQVAKQKGMDSYDCIINSPGGSVEVGNDIYNYLCSQPVTMIGENMVASIATKIFMAAPIENRKLAYGCSFMIHNPWGSGISGNATELKEFAAYLEPIEKELVNTYAKATGLSKEALKGFMKDETFFTAEEAVTLGFASEVLPKFKALAFFNRNNINTNTNSMAKSKLMVAMASALATVGIILPDDSPQRNAVALALVGPDGVDAMTEYDDLVVGDSVKLADGTPAPDGKYQTSDGGYELDVVAGAVTAVTPIDPEASNLSVQVLAQKVQELETALATAQAQLTQANEENEAAAVAMSAIQARITSGYKPKASAQIFKPIGENAPSTKDEVVAAIRAEKERMKNPAKS